MVCWVKMLLPAVSTSVKVIRMILSVYIRLDKDYSRCPFQGPRWYGKPTATFSRDRKQVGSHVDQTEKDTNMCKFNIRIASASEGECQDSAGLCLAIMLHGKSANHCRFDLSTSQRVQGSRMRGYLVPDLRSLSGECKVHARSQGHDT
jgi:hypothetical protein